MIINAAMTRDQPPSEDGQNWQFCAADRGDLATLKAAQIRQLSASLGRDFRRRNSPWRWPIRVTVSSVIRAATVEPSLTQIQQNQTQTKYQPAPRGALSYSRRSREEFGGYSWV
jgi:hypothetical protein